MAKIEFSGIDEYAEALASIGSHAEGICKYAVYDAAGVLCNEIKFNTPVSEDYWGHLGGDLRDSWCLTPFENKDGYIYTRVDCPGYDRNGVPNRIKARVINSGRSDQSGRKKNPFIRRSINNVKDKCIDMMAAALDLKLTEYMSHFKKDV